MKTKEEIEQLAEERYPNQVYYPYLRKGFIEGYTQCQEDNKDKKYTEEEDISDWDVTLNDGLDDLEWNEEKE